MQKRLTFWMFFALCLLFVGAGLFAFYGWLAWTPSGFDKFEASQAEAIRQLNQTLQADPAIPPSDPPPSVDPAPTPIPIVPFQDKVLELDETAWELELLGPTWQDECPKRFQVDQIAASALELTGSDRLSPHDIDANASQ